ncbi:hypothetical protein ACWC2K_31560, partial [Streptomyces chattanoogensis]
MRSSLSTIALFTDADAGTLAIPIRSAPSRVGGRHHPGPNVQPYSGSPANLAAYLAFARPGD